MHIYFAAFREDRHKVVTQVEDYDIHCSAGQENLKNICDHGLTVKTIIATLNRAQELCESRGGRPGLPSLINLQFLWT